MELKQAICARCGYVAMEHGLSDSLTGVLAAARYVLGARNGTPELTTRLCALSDAFRVHEDAITAASGVATHVIQCRREDIEPPGAGPEAA